MSMLPEAKLDVLLAHHASLEAHVLGQLSSEKYVQVTRELSELNPLIDAVKAYRATVSVVDKGVQKGVIHKNTAGRYKARLNARVKAVAAK